MMMKIMTDENNDNDTRNYSDLSALRLQEWKYAAVAWIVL
jgi:hypothetical protein